LAVAVLGVVTYWVVVLSLPDKGPSWHGALRIAFGVVGGLLFVLGIILAAREKPQFVGLSLVGVVLFIVTMVTGHNLDLTEAKRFAIGVGGTALAGLVFGVVRFDTIRAAAAVPVVVLLIGVVTWPGAKDLVSDDVRTEIIKWMGILLAASGVAEAAKQVGESAAKARAPGADVSAKGDLSDAS
jgi:hypothetical protein